MRTQDKIEELNKQIEELKKKSKVNEYIECFRCGELIQLSTGEILYFCPKCDSINRITKGKYEEQIKE